MVPGLFLFRNDLKLLLFVVFTSSMAPQRLSTKMFVIGGNVRKFMLSLNIKSTEA